MNRDSLRGILEALQRGDSSLEDASRQLEHYPFRDLGHTKFDTQREIRSGFAEVVYGAGKELTELRELVTAACESESRLLLTRLSAEQGSAIQDISAKLELHRDCGVAYLDFEPRAEPLGKVAVLSGGTSDSRVAEEAVVCGRFFGLEIERINDVGVAGLPRLFDSLEYIGTMDLLIVVAGMEGALPSVVAGLCPVPLIAVPTSVGYGASFEGITALLSMLVSCSPGLSVVNIDNGFGAALAAAKILKHLGRSRDNFAESDAS